MATFEAVSLIHKLGLKPKRTIRIVFWVNEENGGAGAAELIADDRDKIGIEVAAIEMETAQRSRWASAMADLVERAVRTPPSGRGCRRLRKGFDESTLTAEEKQSFAYP